MRISWKLFISALLCIVGVELNFFENIFLIQFPELVSGILFVGLLVLIFVGILSNDNLFKDLGIMSMLMIGIYYFGEKIPFKALLSPVDPIILKIVSLAMILTGVVIVVLVIVKARQEYLKNESQGSGATEEENADDVDEEESHQ